MCTSRGRPSHLRRHAPQAASADPVCPTLNNVAPHVACAALAKQGGDFGDAEPDTGAQWHSGSRSTDLAASGSSPAFPPQSGTCPRERVRPDRSPVSPRLTGVLNNVHVGEVLDAPTLRLLHRFGVLQPLVKSIASPTRSSPHEAPGSLLCYPDTSRAARPRRPAHGPSCGSGKSGLIMPRAGVIAASNGASGGQRVDRMDGETAAPSCCPPSRESSCGGGLGSGRCTLSADPLT